MKAKQIETFRKEIDKRRKEIRDRKAHDYATEEDLHINFKNMASLMKILSVDITTPEGVAIFYIMLKIDRTCNLLFRRKEKAKAEATEDTVYIDLPNYVDILGELLHEKAVISNVQHKEKILNTFKPISKLRQK